MELKYEVLYNSPYPSFGFNRTFMELKSQIEGTRDYSRLSFNRTFMELKSSRRVRRLIKILVLIVPLWN